MGLATENEQLRTLAEANAEMGCAIGRLQRELDYECESKWAYYNLWRGTSDILGQVLDLLATYDQMDCDQTLVDNIQRLCEVALCQTQD